jgi:CRP-like cAMP-binding protein
METLDELIARSPTFAGLDQAQLELIAGCGRTDHADAGTFLLREGEPAERFFLIRRGVVALELHAPSRPLLIGTLQAGDVLGLSWLFPPYRWQMDGRVVEDCALITFDGLCLRGKCEQDHDLGYELMKRFAANVTDRLQATRLQLLDLYGHNRASA